MIDLKDFEVAAHYMDNEIREELHREMAPCTEEEFLRTYEQRHLEKFGEEFQI